MTQKKITLKKTMLLTSILMASTSIQAAVDCSKEGIAYYFKQGISADQINQLCDSVSGQSAPENKAHQQLITNPHSVANHSSEQQNDLLFFTSMIVADKVEIKDDHLIYVKKDCIKYGEEVEEDVPEYVCGIFHSSLKLSGLEVVTATQGLPLVRDTELVIKGDIKRQVLNFESLDKYTQKMLKRLFVAEPESIDIPLRKDADAEEVAWRLKKMSNL